MLYGPCDIRFEDRPEPTIIKPLAQLSQWSVMVLSGYSRFCRQADGCHSDHRDEPSRITAKLAREFGATDIVIERGDEGVKRIKDMTKALARIRYWSAPARSSR